VSAPFRSIPLPDVERVDERPSKSGEWCNICGRPVNPKRAYDVHVIGGGVRILHPDDEAAFEEHATPDDRAGDMYHFPVGSECVKRIPAEYRRRWTFHQEEEA